MSKIRFTGLYLAGVFLLVFIQATELLSTEAIDIGTAKQFFVDDYIISNMDNVYKVLNQPTKYDGNPVIELKPSQKVGANDLIIADGSVIYDDRDRLFKMWYEGAG